MITFKGGRWDLCDLLDGANYCYLSSGSLSLIYLWVVVVFFGGQCGLGDRDSNRLVTMQYLLSDVEVT